MKTRYIVIIATLITALILALSTLIVEIIKSCSDKETEKGSKIENGLNLLPMVGWYTWPGNGIIISEGTAPNECIINTNGRIPDAAGIVNADLPVSLRGKTIVLYFSNTKASVFSEGRMVKVECDNSTLQPSANAISVKEYITVGDTPPGKGMEFIIPDTFNGKLNLVFYQAKLKNLKITAFYR